MKKQTFESAMVELEQLVQQVEDGQISLDQAVAAYERGIDLVKFCQDKLQTIEERVKVLDGELLKVLPKKSDVKN